MGTLTETLANGTPNMDNGIELLNNNYVDQAKGLLTEIGIIELSEGVWACNDLDTATHAYIHHSRKPTALAAYAAVNATFAAGRFPNYALIDMVDKVSCMDATELTALAMVCGASIPTFPPGRHYNLRPRGEPVPELLKAMRQSYRAISPLQQVMVLTILHLYDPSEDHPFLIGGCPTQIHAAEAMHILRGNGSALSSWGHMVTHYAGW
jgi:hypothetical protein